MRPVAPQAAAADRRWLFGPLPDLLFGCGLAYAAVFVLEAFAGARMRSALPYTTALLPVSLLASAHYGATALRAYERAEDRRGYALFTLWSTLLLGAAFAAGVHVAVLGSWFVTVYLTWSPWHYALQNFGVAMTFLRRRGVDVAPRTRRLLHASFVLSFVLAAVAMHGTRTDAAYAPGALRAGAIAFLPLGELLGVPVGSASVVLVAAGVAYAAATTGALWTLRRAARWSEIAPALVLIATQALWFSVPVLARHASVFGGLEPLSVEHAAYAFLWVGAGHAAQYLWFTAWFAKAQGRSRSHGLFVFKALCAGSALWGVPALLFAPGLLGRVPYDEGLALLVAALVNVHHFVLDGVVWKLRDGRVARFLLGARGTADSNPSPPRRVPALVRAALWTGGLAALALACVGALLPERGFVGPLERDDLRTAERTDALLDHLGQASAERRLQLGQAALSAGDLARAEQYLRASIDLAPRAWAWVGLGDVHARREEFVRASECYEAALALDPAQPVATFHLGVIELNGGDATRGRERVARALELARADPDPPAGLIDAIEGVLDEVDAAEASPERR